MSVRVANALLIGRTSSRLLMGGVLAAACLAWPFPVRAGGPQGAVVRSDGSLSADALVQEALAAEVDGRDRDHDRWVQEARKQSPNYPAARWLDGQVLVGRRWIKIEEVPYLSSRDSKYQEYLRVRSTCGDNAPDQFRLGQWCAKQGLTQQARVHLTRVIQLDNNNAAARHWLGYKRIDGQWRAGAEIQQAEVQAKKLKGDLDRWTPVVQGIKRALSGSHPKQRDKARAQLRAIDTPAALPALEQILAGGSETEALCAAEAMSRIRGPEASLALARLAVRCEWDEARHQAAEQLKSRPLVEFVPPMLAAMSTPLKISETVESRFDGTPVALTETVSREDQAVTETVSVTTRDPGASGFLPGIFGLWGTGKPRPMPSWWPNPMESGDIPLGQLHAVADSYNPQIRELNQKIADALNDATGQRLSSDPRAWWSWWDQYNEVNPPEKPVVKYLDPRYQYDSQGHPVMESCFAAGTPVWTVDGPRPIEQIAVGDLVLAQNVDTGELAYKPVLRTTLRKPVELLTVRVGEDMIRCTGGHNFWVPGSGWTHARKLDPPTRLHGVAGAVEIDSVRPGSKEKTHNLVVADWNTYFVGRGKLLVHDVTLPGPTTTDLPGLKAP